MKNNEEKGNKVTIEKKLEHFWFRHKYEIKDAVTFGVFCVCIGGIAYCCTKLGMKYGELIANNSNLIREIKKQAASKELNDVVQFVIDEGEEGARFSRSVFVDDQELIEYATLIAKDVTKG